MGQCCGKHRIIYKFKDYTSLDELKKEIVKSKVLEDCDIMMSIDCSLSNCYVDGTSRHDIPSIYPRINSQVVNNPYIYIIDILTDLLDDIPNGPNMSLYFYGTTKANNNPTKLQKVNTLYNHFDSNKIKNIDTNVCDSINRLINLYVGGITAIQDKKFHRIFGENNFAKGSSIIPSIEEAIGLYKKNNRFVVLIIISDGLFESSEYKKIIQKICEASAYPISIIFVGLGDNDFTMIQKLDNNIVDSSYEISDQVLKNKKFDNLQTVVLNTIIKRPLVNKPIREELFMKMFTEVPQQFIYVQKDHVLNYKPNFRITKNEHIDISHNIFERSNSDGKHDSIIFVDIEHNRLYLPSPDVRYKPILKFQESKTSSIQMEKINESIIS